MKITLSDPAILSVQEVIMDDKKEVGLAFHIQATEQCITIVIDYKELLELVSQLEDNRETMRCFGAI